MGCPREISSSARPFTDAGDSQKTRVALQRVSTPCRFSKAPLPLYHAPRRLSRDFLKFFLKKFFKKVLTFLLFCVTMKWEPHCWLERMFDPADFQKKMKIIVYTIRVSCVHKYKQLNCINN